MAKHEDLPEGKERQLKILSSRARLRRAVVTVEFYYVASSSEEEETEFERLSREKEDAGDVAAQVLKQDAPDSVTFKSLLPLKDGWDSSCLVWCAGEDDRYYGEFELGELMEGELIEGERGGTGNGNKEETE